MKVTLISPKGPLYRSKGGIFKKSLRYQPLTLTTLASLIPDELNVELELIDEGITDVPDILEVDLIGMTVITGTANRAYELAKRFREQGITVVLGGPHVTLLPKEAALHADAICIGYAEDTWPELLRDYAQRRLKKTYTQAADLSLEERPFAKRELFDKKHFLTQAVFEATRSCAHTCEFCVAPAAWGRKQYQRPVDWVVEDIKQVGQKKNIFIDLNLISDIKYAKELFRSLIPLNIHWYGLSTVLIAHDDELIDLIARSGCKGLLLGLETVSEKSLQNTRKSFNASVKYKDIISELHKLGIAIQGCFVFGLDHDTPDVFDTTVEFVIDTGIDLPRFAVLTPFPGTPLYNRLNSEGRIFNNNWDHYDGQHVVFHPQNMTMDELANGHERAWKKVYSISAIAKRLWNARNFSPLALSANFGYRFYAHNLHRFYNCDWQVDPLFPNPFATESAHSVPIIEETTEKHRIICG
ncbi:MAG: B12-binding domain-containing radical SAM protein [Gammaproteobacteria bacterium]|nr:B12-binding domain-containing radical SAM protein [Gammaproteobacteria bacterium]